MSDTVANVTTKQGRNIDAVTNRSTRPVALLGCWYGENSSLDEASRRDRGGCDCSGNLPHISICRAVGDGLVPPNDKPAFWAWTADTPVVLDTAMTWFQSLIGWAEQTLGARHPDVNLLACCWWNAPAAGAIPEAKQYGMADPRTRQASAEYWLSPDLASRPGGSKYAPNRNNYRRGLAQAEQYRVEEAGVAGNPWQDPEWDYDVGEGVGWAMQANKDHPTGPEVYFPDGATSVTPGEKALYTYSKAGNATYQQPNVLLPKALRLGSP
jgi:hypothetical protein